LTNNIIAFNRQGIYLQSLEYPILSYNLLWENGTRDYIGLDPGENDLAEDPGFVNQRLGNYRLRPDSPCIDAGNPASPRDPDGTVADLGAFWLDRGLGNDYGEDNPPYPPFNRRGGLPLEGLSASPNPFNATTVIRLCGGLDKSAPTRLAIFDLAGREIFSAVSPPRLTATEKTADLGGSAVESVVWDATAYPAGIYIVKVRNGKDMQTMKIVKVD
jgi:parallel beta-helix repeat protein